MREARRPPSTVPGSGRDRLEVMADAETDPPMLATLVDAPFSDPAWIFEPKLDGERGLASRTGERIELWSRNRKALGGTYPEIVEALATEDPSDSSSTARSWPSSAAGRASRRLQQRIGITDPAQGGAARWAWPTSCSTDVTRWPAAHRGSAEHPAPDPGRALLPERGRRAEPGRDRPGRRPLPRDVHPGLGGSGGEAGGVDLPARRSRDWPEIKCVRRQEFVVGGFTEPRGQRVRSARRWWVSTRAGCCATRARSEPASPLGPDRAAGPTRSARAADVTVRARPHPRARPALGAPGAGGRGVVLGMDHRRSAPAPDLPWPARRQGPHRGRPRSDRPRPDAGPARLSPWAEDR